LIILIGHSASGKDTIMNKVVELTNLKPVISYATRPMREGEVDGTAYNFISEEEFQEKLRENFFIETSNYRGWNYGMAKTDCGDDRIVVVDPCGFRALKREGIEIISFFIDVPENERLLRLVYRGDDITELCRRIISDRDTFRGVEFEVDCVVKNNHAKVTAIEIIEELKRRKI
jgi:guanylate kinase